MTESKSYLFITPLTPSGMMSDLRSELFGLYLKALQMQTYKNWKALVICENDSVKGNIQFLKAPLGVITKVDKLIFASSYIQNLEIKPDFVIRLDDDDLISKDILNNIKDLDFDCYADKYHCFFDITSGKIARQKRNWFPNTIIHKYQHAFTPHGKEGYPLIVYDHSQAWLKFYQDKNIMYGDIDNPVYLRIISPTSITANEGNSGKTKSNKFNDYLKTFGEWKWRDKLNGFNDYWTALNRISINYFKPRRRNLKDLIFELFKR